MHLIGQASHLKTFPANEIAKGQYTMKLKKLEEQTKDLKWPVETKKLPVVSWEDCKPALPPVNLKRMMN